MQNHSKKSQHHDILIDSKNGLFACLIDCEIIANKLECSIAFFKGRIKGTIELFADGNYVCTIRIPQEVAETATFYSYINKTKKEFIVCA